MKFRRLAEEIHDKIFTLIGKTGGDAARIALPILAVIVHRARRSDIETAVTEVRNGGKDFVRNRLNDLATGLDASGQLLRATLLGLKDDLDAVPPVKFNSIVNAITESEIVLHSLLDDDFIGALYENMVGKSFSGENGQFFTPKNIILTMREILRLELGKELGEEKSLEHITVLDPCSGSARFLLYWLMMILDLAESENAGDASALAGRAREIAQRNLFAADVEGKIASFACINMLLHGDGATNVSNIDSLNYFGLFSQWPLVNAFASDFDVQWPLLRQRVMKSARRELKENAAFVERVSDQIKTLADTDDLDLCSEVADTFHAVLDVLRELYAEFPGSPWETLESLQRAEDFMSLDRTIRKQWAARNPAILDGVDLVLSNPPFGRGKNLKLGEPHILSQFRLATEAWYSDLSIDQLVYIVQKRGWNIPLFRGTLDNITTDIIGSLTGERPGVPHPTLQKMQERLLDLATTSAMEIVASEDGKSVIALGKLWERLQYEPNESDIMDLLKENLQWTSLGLKDDKDALSSALHRYFNAQGGNADSVLAALAGQNLCGLTVKELGTALGIRWTETEVQSYLIDCVNVVAAKVRAPESSTWSHLIDRFKVDSIRWIEAYLRRLKKVDPLKELIKELSLDDKGRIAAQVRALAKTSWFTPDDVQDVAYRIIIRNSRINLSHTFYYDSGNRPIVLKSSLPKQVLFLEQFLRLVKPGGKVFTVIDNGVMSNLTDEFVRQFLFKESRMIANVEFPMGAFKAAKADVKTAVVMLERTTGGSSVDEPIFGSLPRTLGYSVNDERTPLIPKNDLGRTVCDFALYSGEPRFCSEETCTWGTHGFCTWADQKGFERDTDWKGLTPTDVASAEREAVLEEDED